MRYTDAGVEYTQLPAQLLSLLCFADRTCLVSNALRQQGAFCFDKHVDLTHIQP